MKYIWFSLLIMLIYCAPAHTTTTTSCVHAAPYGVPHIPLVNSQIICRQGLVLQHDHVARIPVWVSYTLNRNQTLACAARLDRFEPDPQLLPHQRAEVSDYRRSGFDQGHMAPNADQSWDPQVQRESFYLSNVTPQLPSLNRGLWRELEAIVRAWAYERQSVTIYVGPVYDRIQNQTIGRNRVVVPHAFFKIIIDNQSGEYQAFWFRHDAQQPAHVHEVRSTLQHVQYATRIQFPLPAHAQESVQTWRYDTRTHARARQKACGVP